MKPLKIILFLIIIISIISCKSANPNADNLYNTTWELDYITGPRITFSGLYPDKSPQISFNKATKHVEGNNSCNGYRAEYTLNGNSITFGDPGPTTMMYCGEGEQTFLTTMKKINAYSFDDQGNLVFKMDDVDMMRFKKVN